MRRIMTMNDRKQARVKMTTLAMLTAISCVLVFITVPYPLFPAFKYDLADVPIMIATFSFGPVAGIIVTAVAAFVQAFILGQDNWIGFTMHMFATGSFVIVSGLIYSRKKTRKGAIIALVAGTVTMAVVMCIANYIMDPLFYGMQKEAVLALILPAILPFNLTKAGINSVITFFVYKRISNMIHRAQGSVSERK
jgi:riboflavin transporter FmnP